MILLPIALTSFLLFYKPVPVQAESAPIPIETLSIPLSAGQPYYQNKRWVLPGQVKEARTLEQFGRMADLALVQYGEHSQYQLWAVLGAQGIQGYESFVDGAQTRDETLSQLSLHLLNPECFSFTLYLPEPLAMPNGLDWTLCEPALSQFCRLADLNETGGMTYPDLPLQGQSNFFIQTGYFPDKYWQGLLVWRIAVVEE